MKTKNLFAVPAFLALCAPAALCAQVELFDSFVLQKELYQKNSPKWYEDRLLDARNFKFYNAPAGALPEQLKIEDWRVTVYQSSSPTFPNEINGGMWNGERLLVRGLTPCYFIENGAVIICDDFDGQQRDETPWFYVVALSNRANTDFFGVRKTTNVSEVQYIVALAMLMGGNGHVALADDVNFVSVPEPSAALMALAGFALLFRRKRRG